MATRTARTEARRSEIVEAALRCFTEVGFEATTIDMICSRSGASVGSLYHHFGDKIGVAAAVAIEGIARYQQGLFDILAGDSTPPDAVDAMVRYHVSWITEHTDWALYLFTQFRAATHGARREVEAVNRLLLDDLAEWIDRHAAAGRLAPLPPRVFLAVVLGPIHELARGFLRRGDESELEMLTDLLASSARRAAGAD
jgi:AcrR family transcriptional regulator